MFAYPTEDELDAIRNAEGWKPTLALAIAVWDADGVTFNLRPEEQALADALTMRDVPGKYVRFATGGWSGNEDIVAALDRNVWAGMSWVLSAAGGLHIYEAPTS